MQIGNSIHAKINRRVGLRNGLIESPFDVLAHLVAVQKEGALFRRKGCITSVENNTESEHENTAYQKGEGFDRR